MKNSHQKHLARWLRKGNISLSRTDFVRGFQEVFEEGFAAHNIISGFENLQEIQDQQEEVITETWQKEEKAQVRAARSLVIQEMKKMKEDWRQNKEITVDGVKNKASWSQRLEHTGKDVEYYSMETQRSTIMHQMLSQKPDSFIIDTQLLAEVNEEAIHNASFAPKPLIAMDWTALVVVTFQLDRAPAEEEEEEEEEEDDDDDDLPLFEPPPQQIS
ncbi:hypothetical protein BHE90_017265 [Fusarium euwallaceae]|uniref:Uncharacterized protein n=1 Tax=Fusarium euwallaceae TaxID=1147111 RepID=A0A430KXY5_9HYPO|nr:hypothetical protein BHE90_017265 [Fusarium euwallaceae]